MRGEAGLRADMCALGIPFAEHDHDAVFTVAESDAVHAAMPGAHTKNLFLKDKGGTFWLITVPSDARVDLKRLPAAIGCKHVSFGKAEDMARLLGITPGSVTPLAAINAVPGSITVVLDAPLADADLVNVHPLRNTATLALAGGAILDLLRHWGHDPVVAPIPVQDNP
ncbi:MAG: prolyl-tRNA synthetase associated domain-containing protein [Burkholderiales bacterium]|nr:prolyl-tRNA synthetase associated domain-containing protein [Burkholderiales bacterium]